MILDGALQAGDDAFGVQSIRRGFCFDPADDHLFALGYPHLFMATDKEVRLDKHGTLKSLFKRHRLRPESFPAALVHWVLDRWDTVHRRRLWSETAVSDEAPPHDLDALISKPPGAMSTFLVFALEAVHGSAVVAERLVSAVESWPNEGFGHKPDHRQLLRALYFLLLRVPSTHHDRLVDRLETVYDRVSTECLYGDGSVWRNVGVLDMVLHGRRAVEDHGYRPDRVTLTLVDLVFADDDLDWVNHQVQTIVPAIQSNDKPYVEPRLAWLGGPDTVELMCDHVLTFHSKSRAAFADAFGRIDHPSVRGAMETLKDLAGAKRQAKDWLRAHSS